MRWLAVAMSIFVCSVEVAAAICEAPKRWPGKQSADVVFAGVRAVEPAKRGDGPDEPMPVSLNPDVLSLGGELSLSSGALVARGPVTCVRYRPEWLGLTLANTGANAAGGTLKINLGEGAHLEAELPVLMPGEVRSLLVMSGENISAIAADAFELVAKHD
jgi:hypothetical protein